MQIVLIDICAKIQILEFHYFIHNVIIRKVPLILSIYQFNVVHFLFISVQTKKKFASALAKQAFSTVHML